MEPVTAESDLAASFSINPPVNSEGAPINIIIPIADISNNISGDAELGSSAMEAPAAIASNSQDLNIPLGDGEEHDFARPSISSDEVKDEHSIDIIGISAISSSEGKDEHSSDIASINAACDITESDPVITESSSAVNDIKEFDPAVIEGGSIGSDAKELDNPVIESGTIDDGEEEEIIFDDDYVAPAPVLSPGSDDADAMN